MYALPRLLVRAVRLPRGGQSLRSVARLPDSLRLRGFRAGASLRADIQPATTPDAAAPESAAAASAESASASVPPADALKRALNEHLKAAQYDEVIKLFETQLASAPSTLSREHWNAMLQALDGKGLPHTDVSAGIDRMRAAGVSPSATSYTHALRACVRGKDPAADLASGRSLVEQARSVDGIEAEEHMLTELLRLHIRAGDTDGARGLLPVLCALRAELLALITAASVSRFRASYIYLTSTLQHDAITEFMIYLSEQRAQNLHPRGQYMRTILRQAVATRSPDATIAALDVMLANGEAFEPMPALILLANSGAFDSRPAEAERILRRCVPLLRPSNFYSSDRVHVLERLLPLLTEPDLKMRVIAVIAATRPPSKEVGAALYEMAMSGKGEGADDAFNVLQAMHERGERVTTAAVNAVITMCAHLRDLDRAVETFQAIEGTFSLRPNTGSYNALLLAAHKTRQAEGVKQIRSRMGAAGLSPDQDTYRITAMHLLDHEEEAEASSILEQAKAAGMANGGLYSIFLKYYLRIPDRSVRHPRRPPDLDKGKALRDEALEGKKKLHPRLIEQVEAVLAGGKPPDRADFRNGPRSRPSSPASAGAQETAENYEVAEGEPTAEPTPAVKDAQ